MKKFTRILVFLLVLATLASLFAVSAFASEEEIPSSVAVDYAAKWEGKEKDDFIGIDESYKGNVYVGVSDDGNRYGIFETKESEASSNNKLEEELSAAPSVKDYPYAVIDFDIMTPGGAYETDIIISFFVNTANKYLANVKVSAFSNFLDSVAGEWQHVTVIMQRCCDIDDEGKIASFNLKFSYFVDGVKVCETEGNKLSSMNGFDAAATGFSQVRFVIPSVFSENEKTAFDNVAINYFAENSTEEEMAGVVYGEDYELPYGNTVAKIGETVYDDINKAVAAASAGDKITLFADVAEPVQIDKNIKVDTQKGAYRFAYTTDGKRDADNQEGIYVFYYLDTAYAAVNWVDADGNVLATTKAIKGEIAEMPLVSIYTEADLYRDILIQNWINADGEENYVIGYEDSYTFTAVAPEINENTKYVANLKDLQFNVAYYAQFVCYFYLPVEASMQAPVVSGFDPAAAETVYIHDIE